MCNECLYNTNIYIYTYNICMWREEDSDSHKL